MGEAKVFTVEHVMAAFSAMNIDNCYIEMDSPEPAVGDGSSAIFCRPYRRGWHSRNKQHHVMYIK